MDRWKFPFMLQTGFIILVLFLVVIAGVNLQRHQRILENRIADLENHAGAQDLAICAMSEVVLGRACQTGSGK